MHADACGCISAQAKMQFWPGTNADTRGSIQIRDLSSDPCYPRLSAAQYRHLSFRSDRSYERSSVFPAALRARVTNGATFFGKTSFAARDRRKSFFPRGIFA